MTMMVKAFLYHRLYKFLILLLTIDGGGAFDSSMIFQKSRLANTISNLNM